MPTLRTRKSIPPHAQDAQDDDEDSDDAMSLDYRESWESSSDSEESGSDWECRRNNGRKKGPSRSPAKKRVVVSGPTGSTKNVSKGKSRSRFLGELLDMPMDILFEVFSCLSPKDLIALTRTSKTLRTTLLSRNAVTVWKNVRERVGAPPASCDFSEPRWAGLLFGDKNCQCCGAKNVNKVDFMLRRRVCVACKKQNLVLTSKFSAVFPDYEVVILDFISYTNVGGWAHGHASSSKFYWQGDVEKMARKWGLLNKDVHMRIPGSRQTLENFRQERKTLVSEIIENAAQCRRWFDIITKERVEEEMNKSNCRYHAIVERFQTLGYLQSDIDAIQFQTDATQGAELTDRIWKRVQPILEPMVQKKKAERLAIERQRLVESRTNVVDKLYKSHLKCLKPSEVFFQPCIAQVCEFPQFNDLVRAADDVTINAASFANAMEQLPGLIIAWTEQQRNILLDLISTASKDTASTTSPGTSSQLPVLPTPADGPSPQSTTLSPPRAVDPLDLATSVFECGRSCVMNASPWEGRFANCLIAWEGVNTHRCKIRLDWHIGCPGSWGLSRKVQAATSVYKFSRSGSAAAISLILAAGLRPDSATPADMDHLDLLFFCSFCGPQQHRYPYNKFGNQVYTWRSAIGHAMAVHTLARNQATWTILNAAERDEIKRSEHVDPAENDSCWTCNHCAIHLDDYQTRSKIIDHLKAAHNIVNWNDPRDLFMIPQRRCRSLHAPVFKTQKPGQEFRTQKPGQEKSIRCKHCSASSTRLFTYEGIQSHSKAKHMTSDRNYTYLKDVDWVTVN